MWMREFATQKRPLAYGSTHRRLRRLPGQVPLSCVRSLPARQPDIMLRPSHDSNPAASPSIGASASGRSDTPDEWPAEPLVECAAQPTGAAGSTSSPDEEEEDPDKWSMSSQEMEDVMRRLNKNSEALAVSIGAMVDRRSWQDVRSRLPIRHARRGSRSSSIPLPSMPEGRELERDEQRAEVDDARFVRWCQRSERPEALQKLRDVEEKAARLWRKAQKHGRRQHDETESPYMRARSKAKCSRYHVRYLRALHLRDLLEERCSAERDGSACWPTAAAWPLSDATDLPPTPVFLSTSCMTMSAGVQRCHALSM